MLKGHCPACLQPFQDGDECKEVGNNTITMVLGKKSGQMVPMVLNDPRNSVIVHRHCTVLHENPHTNDEYLESVEEAKRPQWEKDWEEENMERIRLEAYELANDDLKRMCACCYEEIEHMANAESDNRPPLPPAPPIPWGVTS